MLSWSFWWENVMWFIAVCKGSDKEYLQQSFPVFQSGLRDGNFRWLHFFLSLGGDKWLFEQDTESLIDPICSNTVLYLEDSVSHWIVHLNDSFKNTNSFSNATILCCSEVWLILLCLLFRLCPLGKYKFQAHEPPSKITFTSGKLSILMSVHTMS